MAKNPAAVALGRRGGLKGGPARAAKLSPEERAAIATKASHSRRHFVSKGMTDAAVMDVLRQLRRGLVS